MQDSICELQHRPYTQWKIPKSFDRFVIDSQTAENFAYQHCLDMQSLHDLALHENDVTKLFRSWATFAEQTLAQAAVDVEGKSI